MRIGVDGVTATVAPRGALDAGDRWFGGLSVAPWLPGVDEARSSRGRPRLPRRFPRSGPRRGDGHRRPHRDALLHLPRWQGGPLPQSRVGAGAGRHRHRDLAAPSGGGLRHRDGGHQPARAGRRAARPPGRAGVDPVSRLPVDQPRRERALPLVLAADHARRRRRRTPLAALRLPRRLVHHLFHQQRHRHPRDDPDPHLPGSQRAHREPDAVSHGGVRGGQHRIDGPLHRQPHQHRHRGRRGARLRRIRPAHARPRRWSRWGSRSSRCGCSSAERAAPIVCPSVTTCPRRRGAPAGRGR